MPFKKGKIRNMKATFNTTEQLPSIAEQLVSTFHEERFFAFFGAMGVGKTTLIKEICNHLGICDNVCSPTFAIINEYRSSAGDPVYHFDFYRIKNIEEAYDIGYEEYFYSGDYCFVEWSEKIETILPDRYVQVTITECDGVRELSAELVSEI